MVTDDDVIAVITPLGMKSYPLIMASMLDTNEVKAFHIKDLKKDISPSPGKGITSDNRIVNYIPAEEECDV